MGLNSANLAGLLAAQGHGAEAIDWLDRTLTAEDSALYWLNLGHFYEQQPDWAATVFAYGQALRRNPALAGSGFWGADDDRVARWPQIVAVAVESDSASGEASRRLAIARFQYLNADRLPEDAVTTLAGTGQFQTTLLEWHLNRGEVTQATTMLNPQPNSGSENVWWGWAKLQAGELDSAEELLQTAAFQRQRQAYYYLGQLYQQQGKVQAAEDAYSRAFLLASPENIEVTIYGRFGGNDLVPQLIRIGDINQVQPLKALIQLYAAQQRTEDIDHVHNLLRQIDPFFESVRP